MFQSKTTLPDGTIEVTDTLPKQDYYKSLRRHSSSSPGSQFAINNSTNVYDATSGYRKSKAIDYKPSGKQVQCSVLMLEGVEQIFTIDVCHRILIISLDFPMPELKKLVFFCLIVSVLC